MYKVSKIINDNLKETENKLRLSLYSIPNTPDRKVPEGKSDKENKIIFSSDISKNETLKPHWDLIKEFQIIDFELGNNITGAGFPVYIGKGAHTTEGADKLFPRCCQRKRLH